MKHSYSMIKNSKKTLIKYAGLFMLSFIFLLLFSLWTSPFYKNWYGCDASFFTMAGRGITKGWVPYVDFFDLKGPYFFFIQAIGQLFAKARMGAFILQIFALFFSLILMIKTCRLFVSTKKTGFIVSIFLIFHVATLWGGNTLEEYMLPLSLLSIYLVLKDLYKLNKIRGRSALITGICFSVILFSKITVASPIIGLVLTIIVFFISRRRFYELFEFLLYAFLGVLIGITPIFIYFAVNHALMQMLYSVFIFAFKRSIDFGTKYNIRWELKISGCYFAIIFVICQILPRGICNRIQDFIKNKALLKQKKIVKQSNSNSSSIATSLMTSSNGMLVSFLLTLTFWMAVITAVALHFGDPFIYYFTTVYPTLMVCFIAMFLIYDPFILFRKWRLDIPLVAFMITACYFASHTASTLNTVIYDRDNTYYQDYVDKANEMASLIPKIDRDNVYSFNMDMQWFECNQILPCYTYTINLQFFVALDQRIEETIIKKLYDDPPKWIVVGGDLGGYLPNINDIVVRKYKNVYENEYGALYLLQ